MSNKIRILHIAEPSIAGVPRYIRMLLKYMDRSQFENYLIGSYGYQDKEWTSLVSGLERIDMRHEIGVHDLKTVCIARRLIKKYQPDIIYAHSSKAGVIARMANIGLKNTNGKKIKCVYNPHGWAFNMKCGEKKQKIYVMIERLFAPLCTKIVAISDYEKESAIKRHICNPEKIQVIYNGIDFEEYPSDHVYPTRQELKIPADAFVVGTVGRLDPQKAPDVFVKAAEQIKKSIPNAFFVMVGSGTQEEEIIRMIEERGLKDSFLITGWVEDPYDYINTFDVATLLSRWEGFGLVLPEYMLFGKPIVATRVDAIPNIIEDGVNGLLVEADDYVSVAESVVKVYRDEKLKERLILEETEGVWKKFNVMRVSEEHKAMFDEIIK